MSTKWMVPVAALAVVSMIGCGGGEEQAPATRSRAKAPAEGAAKAAAGATGGYSVAAVADAGSVMGKITFTGEAPAAEVLEISKDISVCGEEKTIETMRVADDGGLADAVVWVEGITQGKDWGMMDGGTVDQKECHYTPDIQIIKEGDAVEIVNSDPILHNVHAYSGEETLFNLAQPTQGMKTPKTLDKSGPVHFKCDVHSWMSAWVFVAAHPYYTVTTQDGSFTIDGLPAGTYTIKAWHPVGGEKTAEVMVAASGSATADIALP